MKKILFIAAFLVAISGTLPLNAQNNDLTVLNEIALSLYKQQETAVRPVLLLHTDRLIYSPGQTVWFSLYSIQSGNHQPYQLEQSLYVILSDKNRNPLKVIRLLASGLTASGAFDLSDSIPEGAYLLTAFTKGMTGENSHLAAFRELIICKPGTKADRQQFSALGGPPDQEFRFSHHIEGGNLISGINNRVIFTCYDSKGRPVSLPGRITNLIDTQIIHFQTNAAGLAEAWIPAVKNRKYKATVIYEGTEYSVSILPSPVIAWQVSITARKREFIKVRVALSDSLYKTRPASYLLLTAAGKILFAANGKGMYETEIPLEQIPNGIATVLLYNEKKECVSSRRFLVTTDTVQVQITPNMTYWSSREPVKLKLLFSDGKGKPVSGNYSVSVTDLAFTEKQNVTDETMTGSLLTPYLTGKKLSPAVWANLTRDPEWLDMLLLTTVSSENTYKWSKEPESDTLHGVIRNPQGSPLAFHRITVFSTTGGSLVLTDTSDAAGRFSFPMPRLMGQAWLNFQAVRNGKIATDAVFEIEAPQVPALPDLINYCEPDTNSWEKQTRKYLEGTNTPYFLQNKATVLPTAQITHRITDYSELIARKRVHKGSWIASPDLIDQAGEGSLANVVLSAPGVSLMGGYLTIQGGMRGISGAVTAKSEPLVVVNGIQMNLGSDQGQLGMNLNISPVMNFLNTFSNRNVEFIEVLTGSQAAQYGTVGAGGVILINTGAVARTSVYEKNENKDFKQELWQGYHIPEQFPSPDYTEKSKKGENLPDQRITLYWNSSMYADSTGKSQISFFTSDHSGPFLVTLQGITATGTLFRKEIILNRRKDQ